MWGDGHQEFLRVTKILLEEVESGIQNLRKVDVFL
jgi:hypothetical protein